MSQVKYFHPSIFSTSILPEVKVAICIIIRLNLYLRIGYLRTEMFANVNTPFFIIAVKLGMVHMQGD